MIILVDLDGVVADFLGTFLPNFYGANPLAPRYEVDQITEFYMENLFGKEWNEAIYEIMLAEGFYGSLGVMPGAVEGIRLLQEQGNTVIICTAPMPSPWCGSEKFSWVADHLDKELATKMIVTKDKTLIRGDFLIDDKPVIPGIMTPEWEHILYDQPYNRHVTDRRRFSWSGRYLIPKLERVLRP